MTALPEAGVEYLDDERLSVVVEAVSGGRVSYFRMDDDPVFNDPAFDPELPFEMSVEDFVKMTGLVRYGDQD